MSCHRFPALGAHSRSISSINSLVMRFSLTGFLPSMAMTLVKTPGIPTSTLFSCLLILFSALSMARATSSSSVFLLTHWPSLIPSYRTQAAPGISVPLIFALSIMQIIFDVPNSKTALFATAILLLQIHTPIIIIAQSLSEKQYGY